MENLFLCRELAKDTYQTIAEKFNKKDHTTVIAAVQKVSELYETDAKVRASIDELRTILGGS